MGLCCALACAGAWDKLFHFSLPLIYLLENEIDEICIFFFRPQRV